MPVPIALWLTGTSGDYASVPDDVSLDITGDITIEAEAGVAVMPPAADIAFVSKWTVAGNQRSYWFGATDDGSGNTVLLLKWSSNGTNELTAQGVVPLPVPSNASRRLRYRVVLDVDDGAGGHTVTFSYYNPDDANTLTQLGNVLQDPGGAGTTSIFASTAPVNIGASEAGTADLFAGQISYALISDGTAQLDADFSVQTLEATSFTEASANAHTVTINQAGVAPNTAEIREVTTFFTWRVPTQGSSTDIWGEPLNEAYGDDSTVLDSIDTVIKAVSDDLDLLETGVENADDRIGAAETLFNLPRYARVHRISNFAFGAKGGPAVLIPWDTVQLDKRNWFSLANPTRLTKEALNDPPSDGLHLVRVVLKLPSSLTGHNDSYSYTVRLLKNGAAFAQATNPTLNDNFADDSGFTTVRLQALTNLVPSDYVEVDIAWNADSGGSISPAVQAGASDSWFEVVRVPSASTPGIPAGLLSGILFWYEARLQRVLNGYGDEAEVDVLIDQTTNADDAPATDANLAELDTDSHASFNGQPVFRPAASDAGIYTLSGAGAPDPDHMSVIVIIRPSTPETTQRFWFDAGPGAADHFRMRNDGAGADDHEVLFTARANTNNTSLRSSTVDPGVYDGNAHAVLCTYDGVTMRVYVDDMTVVNNSVVHGGGGVLEGVFNTYDIMHQAAGSAFEGEYALVAAWDHHLTNTERDTLAAFLLSEYNIS